MTYGGGAPYNTVWRASQKQSQLFFPHQEESERWRWTEVHDGLTAEHGREEGVTAFPFQREHGITQQGREAAPLGSCTAAHITTASQPPPLDPARDTKGSSRTFGGSAARHAGTEGCGGGERKCVGVGSEIRPGVGREGARRCEEPPGSLPGAPGLPVLSFTHARTHTAPCSPSSAPDSDKVSGMFRT